MRPPSFVRIILQLTVIGAILVCAAIGVLLVLDIGPAYELREAFIKTLQVVGIVAVASLLIMLVTGKR